MEENNSTIFKYLKPYDNIKLSDIRRSDIIDLLVLINDFLLTYRNRIGISNNITFGLELECENSDDDEIKHDLEDIKLDKFWPIEGDGSLEYGSEINSPILRDYEKNWEQLSKVCSILSKHSEIGKYAAGHVHVGAHILGDNINYWLNFIKLWSAYENIIFRFSYGEYLGCRPRILKYASPISKLMWEDYDYLNIKGDNKIEDVIDVISHKREQAVNFINIDYSNCNKFIPYSTIEFRCPNGTLNPIIWQNNVNLFIKMLLYSKEKNFSENIIKDRHDVIFNNYDSLEWYDEIYLEQALEFCDMIFKNNMDKVYFLRQYLKDYEVNREKDGYRLVKKFTK